MVKNRVCAKIHTCENKVYYSITCNYRTTRGLVENHYIQASNQALLACRANTLSFAAATLPISPTRCRYAEKRATHCRYVGTNHSFFIPFENCEAAVSQQTQGADAMLAESREPASSNTFEQRLVFAGYPVNNLISQCAHCEITISLL